MKKVYEAPAATVITLAAVEKLAALDGHPDSAVNAVGDDIIDSDTDLSFGRPKSAT